MPNTVNKTTKDTNSEQPDATGKIDHSQSGPSQDGLEQKLIFLKLNRTLVKIFEIRRG